MDESVIWRVSDNQWKTFGMFPERVGGGGEGGNTEIEQQ
jgi:hypothetical protein